MAVATSGDQEIWSCTVNFAYDEKLNLYFLSRLSSKHMQHISSKPKIAVSLFDPNTSVHKVGIQLSGNAEIVGDIFVDEIFDIYFSRYGKEGNSADNYKGNAEWKFVKVTPTEVYYFDTNTPTEDRLRVDL